MSSNSNRSGSTTSSLSKVYEKYLKDKKIPPSVPTIGFLLTIIFGIPSLLIMLPLSLGYQIIKMMSVTLLPKTTITSEALKETTVDQKFPSLTEIRPMKERKYDLVLLGSTGFTGSIAAAYLAKTYGVNKDIKWAIAGRSPSKLKKLKQKIAEKLGDETLLKNLDIIITDTTLPSTLHDLVHDTRVVASTAGPFYAYGSSVVEYCVKYGTHYVDITGEVDWSQDMITKWDTLAQRTGAKIISFCGHDSIPWDLCARKLGKILEKECNDDLLKIEFYNNVLGKVSGGTIATALLAIDRGMEKPKYLFDPFLKLPDGSKSNIHTKISNPTLPQKCTNGIFQHKWTTPFVMADVNGAVVKRSNALQPGGNFTKITYQESMICADFKMAFCSWFGTILFIVALLNPITGFLIKKVLPKPGEGPSEQEQNDGFLLISGVGIGSKGSVAECLFYFPKDGGYSETARMLVESGLCLALDSDKLVSHSSSPGGKGGGFFTPASGMGDALLERLVNTGSMFGYEIKK